MRLLLMVLMVSTAGCAHKTIHEYCSDPETAARYKDYDQCYRETSATGGPPSLGRALGGVLKKTGEAQQGGEQRTTSCRTTAYGNIADTNCNSN